MKLVQILVLTSQVLGNPCSYCYFARLIHHHSYVKMEHNNIITHVGIKSIETSISAYACIILNSLENQTTPFCSTGCIASPAPRREGLATLAELL